MERSDSTMKAVLRIAIAAVSAAIAFSSCENLNDEYISVSDEIVINASVAEQSVETRSAIDVFGSEKVTYTWLAGDAISVFFGDSEGSIFVTDVTASKAQFKGTIGAVMGGGDDLTDETSLWGVYPYDRNTTCDGSSVTLTLPYEQVAAPDTFADDLFPSIARSTNFTMAFYPVCGSIRFKVSNPDIVKVALSGNNNEDLAGKAIVSMPLGGVPAMGSISEGQKELVMTSPDGGCFETDRYYYFVLYPQDLTKGLTLTFYKEYEKASYVLNSSVKVGRNRFLSATNKDSGLTFTVLPNVLIDYIDENGNNQGKGILVGKTVWAPVNCGYHKTDYPYGKLYQWGRKYGQGYDESDATYPSIDNGTIKKGGTSLSDGQSEANMDVFFLGNSVKDWLSPSDNSLWNSGTESSPVKNVNNDPCPDGWRVPTYAELHDLWSKHSDLTTDESGQNGRWFSGTTSYSEDIPRLFIPANGRRYNDSGDVGGRGSSGYYWSSRADDSLDDSRAFDFHYYATSNLGSASLYRSQAKGVRCVKDANSTDEEELVIPVSTVTLSSTSLKLYEGDKAVLTAKVMPTDATNPKVTWSSDAPGIVYVDQNGEVTAISKGSATITATADGVSKTCAVTVSSLVVATANYVDEYGKDHGKGIAIGGSVWAPVNCGYKAPEKDEDGNITDDGYPFGKLYQWGRKYGQGYNDDSYSDATYPSVEEGTIKEGGVSLAGGQSDSKKDVFFLGYSDNKNDWLYQSDDNLWNSGTETSPKKNKDYDPCPEGWRVPTFKELEELIENHSTWTVLENGHRGYWFSGLSTYDSDVPQIFLPAAGSRFYYAGDAFERGEVGYYWSSSSYSEYGNYLYFLGNVIEMDYDFLHSRASGYSVRCVQE